MGLANVGGHIGEVMKRLTNVGGPIGEVMKRLTLLGCPNGVVKKGLAPSWGVIGVSPIFRLLLLLPKGEEEVSAQRVLPNAWARVESSLISLSKRSKVRDCNPSTRA